MAPLGSVSNPTVGIHLNQGVLVLHRHLLCCAVLGRQLSCPGVQPLLPSVFVLDVRPSLFVCPQKTSGLLLEVLLPIVIRFSKAAAVSLSTEFNFVVSIDVLS